MKKIFIYIALFAFISSCTTGKIYSKKKDIFGSWVLLNDDNEEVGLQNKSLNIVFSKEGQTLKINGFAGCNNYFGNFTNYLGNITISNIASTRMACPQSEVEQNYFELLRQVNRFERKDNDLMLYKDNLLLLHYRNK